VLLRLLRRWLEATATYTGHHMPVENFIAELERRGLLSEPLMAKLRDKLAESARPWSAEAIAKFLVEKEHLTQRQATDVLRYLAQSGVDVDSSPADEVVELVEIEPDDEATPIISPVSSIELMDDSVSQLSVDDLENDYEGSSIFAPFLSEREDEPHGAAEDEEIGLAPGSDDAPLEIDAPLYRMRAAATSELEESTRPGKSKSLKLARQSVQTGPLLEDSTELPTKDTAAALRGKDKRLKKKKPLKRANKWDSPLILLGGGGLALLLLCGLTVWWLLIRESGDQKLKMARAALDSGGFSQAIERFEDFLASAPRHPERSLARVQLAMARVRQPTEVQDFPAALEIAQNELDAIEDEKDFSEAQGELASLLPQIAMGLATQAEKAVAAASDPAPSIELSRKALAMCSNVAYVPKTLRDETKLTEVEELLQRVERGQRTQVALNKTLKVMEQSVAGADAIAAYAAYRQLVRQHPDLASDAGLVEMLKKATTAEQAAIRFVDDKKAAATTERPTPWLATLAVANRRLKPTAAPGGGAGKGTACVRVDGAVYGLDVATGRLLWRRYVGHASAAWPIPIGNNVLIVDADRKELLRLDTATGRLVWRQEIGEPFAEPLIVGERAFIAGDSGKLHVVDLKSGEAIGYLQFAQPLRVTPADDRKLNRLYLPGDHSSLYVVSLTDLKCLEVYYLGHAEGSIRVSPAVVLDKLAVLENDGVETSRFRLLSISKDGSIGAQVRDRRLTGLPTSSPFVTGRRLIVLTDRGQVEVYEIGAGDGDGALTLIATRAAAGSNRVVRHAALTDRHIWIGDTQLAKYSILPTGNRLPVETIENNFTGATFDHPLALFGETLIHVRRPKGRGGYAVAATNTAQGRTIWETDLAMPPAGPPVVDESTKSLAVASSEGSVFRFDEAAIRSRVQDTPVVAEAVPADLPPFTMAVDLGQGRAAFGAPGADRILLYNPTLKNGSAQWIKLPSPLACAITPLGEGFIAPLQVGQVFLLNSGDGAQRAVPFQPLLQPNSTWDYRPAAVVGADARRFVIADGRDKIYLVALENQPQSHLKLMSEVNAGGEPIESSMVVLGDSAFAIAGSSQLVRFRLPSLELEGEAVLPAPVVWGPHQVADVLLLATANGELLAISADGDVMWKSAVEHGDLAGAPLALPDGVILAYRNGIIERRAITDGKPVAARSEGRRQHYPQKRVRH